MKKVFVFTLLVLLSFLAQSQAPQFFNYQAVVRDATGNLLSNQTISLRISIVQGSLLGTTVYQETHSVVTNTYGQASLSIGAGTPGMGSFSAIDWSLGNYFVKTEVDVAGGSAYIFMGTSLLQSVPYALYAKTAGYTSGTGIGIAGTTITNTAPDQVVTLTPGTGISTVGTYPNFTLTNTKPNATHTGDATGSDALTVIKLRGRELADVPPSNGQVLKWNNTLVKWTPSDDVGTTYNAGTGISIAGGQPSPIRHPIKP
jgi:hypothetical protein